MLVVLAVASVAARVRDRGRRRARLQLWLLPLIAVGAFLVLAYNLELFGGRFHTDLWFALAWGAFPVAHRVRRLRRHASRRGRRRRGLGDGSLAGPAPAVDPGSTRPPRRRRRRPGSWSSATASARRVTREMLVAAPEAALRLLAAATVLIAAALVAVRL